MKSRFFALTLGVLVSPFSVNTATAAPNTSEIALDVQHSKQEVWGYRLGYRQPLNIPLPEFLSKGYLYHETSLNYWRHDESQHDEAKGVAWSPVYLYPLSDSVFFEFGIGVSYFSASKIDGRDLGTHFLFEDRAGLRWQISPQHSLTLRYFHYSNADIKKPNDGIDFMNLSYGMAF